MLATQFRHRFSALAAALLLAAMVTGCGWFTDRGSDSATTAPPPTTATQTVSPAPNPLDSLHLDQFWVRQNLACLPTEADVPQTPRVASLVKVCHQSPTVYRLLNTSQTSVRVTYRPARATIGWMGAHARDGAVTTQMLVMMDAGVVQGNGFLVLPAGDSAMVTLNEAGVGMPSVASDPEHGSRAFLARMIGKLVDEVPWDKIGELGGIAAKAVACVGGVLSLVEKGEVAIDEAIETADQCREMSEEISERWERRAAKTAPKAPALRSKFATLARPGAPVATSIKGTVVSVVELAFRRF